ncbi:Flp pilus assembly complex ATPase component TadA [Aliifodinibius sp. S!AR15-10]|uniref:GspE/PulE family protein n=1 Tax=Aliifodinibius sp. S!AR15-10 TaxID=2950437 RepID=UPI002867696F|nr:ATPase, T2SS/T4P/T4SS family [Aliifodinibius sp. S!AR15-10]MDR8391610.1 Flp pilus assembly complex ATPase component TadA [Aliifodinibius sp. S!AR15-10]
MGKVNTRRHIGNILLNRGVISEEQLSTANSILEEEPESTNRRLGQILYQDLGLDRHAVMKEIANIYAFDEVFEGVDKIDGSVIEEIQKNIEDLPQEIIDELVHQKAVPLQKSQNELTIAAADPSDPTLSTIISRLNFKHFEIFYCRYELVEQILTEVYEQKNEFLDLLEEIDYEEPDLQESEDQIDEEEIDAEINQSMLNSLVEGMLVEAVRQGVSDIHIIPTGKTTTDIRFRIDGKLQMWYEQKNVKPEAISAVVKDKTRNVDRFERDASQDGFIQRAVDNHSIRYRVSIMPMVGEQFDRKFESIVIRILDDRKVITDLGKLGLQTKAKEDFVKAIEKPSGIVIVTGPTGSGKSTTLVAALYYVIEPTVNVLTVEDPVEYLIEGARQLKLSNHMTFDQAMRGILRHDPDIVLVGEIRDLKTAEIAIKLANTGHLTFSTLHTNDAPSAISRLYKMGVEPFLISSAVNLIMAQRLVRRLCSNCKEAYEPHPETAKGIGFTEKEVEETTFYRAVGCEKCNGIGFKGRAAIMEALYFDKQIRKMILESGSEIDELGIKEYAMSQGMLSLRGSGRERIKSGITTIEEIVAITIED